MSAATSNSACIGDASSLTFNHPLVAEILSYLVSNTRDLARLRLISKNWNDKVVPFILKSQDIINICYPNTEFLEGLVEVGAGQVFDFSDDGLCSIFQEGGIMRSILLVSDERVLHGSKVVGKDCSFPTYCETLCNTKSYEEFQKIANEALTGGMFLSVSEFENGKTDDKDDLHEDVPVQDGYYTFAVIVTEELPRAVVTIAQEGNSQVVLFHSAQSSDEPRRLVVPFNKQGTFKAYVTKETEDVVTCLIPLRIKIDWEYMWAIKNKFSAGLLPLTALWSRCQERSLVPEGIALVDGIVPECLHTSLMQQIDRLAANTPVDYHPHSRDIVRDLVHPYSYVKGVSAMVQQEEVPPATFPNIEEDQKTQSNAFSSPRQTDYWGRAYEASLDYQWLPTYFDVASDGSCSISDYINNLVPRSRYEDLYTSLAQLFSQALPLIESVFSYGRVVRSRIHNDDDDDCLEFQDELPDPIEEVHYSLRGQRLQVVTKIVDYELDTGQSYEGAWHVEGMSHEEIVATALYFIHRDEDINGGDILFKRAFHEEEAQFIYSSVHPSRLRDLGDVIEAGLVPLGKVETLSRRLLVFPNSHAHKTTKMNLTPPVVDTNNVNVKQKRRIIAFFLVNPGKRIVSTREVPEQQEELAGAMSREEAMEHRLELMNERRYTKQDWNVREIELCEY